MADLLDILPASTSVWIEDQRFTVHCISIPAMASIITRFPEIKDVLRGGLAGDFILRLRLSCAAALGPIIAAGCGYLGNEDFERHAASMLPEYQGKFLNAIWDVTFPNGTGPFLEELAKLFGEAGEKSKTYKIRSKKSHSPSQSSSDKDSHQILQ
ncbi:MAG TPA: hypothetical protein VKG24_29185 [Pseudolabrys sp.]|nr:hypothetical protein [Pseudolabrys sp.]